MIKAAVFDIDETLFDSKKKVYTPSAVNALQDLESRGITVILATGRPPASAAAVNAAGIHPSYIVCINGHLVLDSENHIILSRTFPEKLVERIYEYCRKEGIGLLFKYPDHTYEYIHSDVFQQFYNKTVQSRATVVVGVTDEHTRRLPNGGNLACSREKQDEFNRVFDHEAVSVRINDECSDLLLYGVTKKTGVEMLLNQLHIRPEEVIAFGDNDNDLEMNEYAGIGVAMGNGSAALKKQADYITDSINNDGVAKALRHFQLI